MDVSGSSYETGMVTGVTAPGVGPSPDVPTWHVAWTTINSSVPFLNTDECIFSWALLGPTGAAGATGATGPTGPQGPTGPTSQDHHTVHGGAVNVTSSTRNTFEWDTNTFSPVAAAGRTQWTIGEMSTTDYSTLLWANGTMNGNPTAQRLDRCCWLRVTNVDNTATQGTGGGEPPEILYVPAYWPFTQIPP